MDMDIRKVAKVLFCISQNKSDEDIIKMMKIGNIKADDNDTNPLGIGHTPLHVAAIRGMTTLLEVVRNHIHHRLIKHQAGVLFYYHYTQKLS